MGYAGGTTPGPTYTDIGDHSETVQIDYDPLKISYDELLHVFWDSHNPALPPGTRQYMSIIYFHNEEQKNLALVSREHEETRIGQKIITEVVPYSQFYLAEDYHQKYNLRREYDLIREFQAFYPETRQLIGSTAAARVNGYAGGYGTFAALQEQIPYLGLSPEGEKTLLEIGRRLLPANE